eukprot:SAG11_NODE_3547_length_2377_cov_3.176471_3_plen_110_part_00
MVWQSNNHLANNKPKEEKNPASVMGAEASFQDEIFSSPGTDVPMKAGDLLLGDSRLLHRTHPNSSTERRTCITLWCECPPRGCPAHGCILRGCVPGAPIVWSCAAAVLS